MKYILGETLSAETITPSVIVKISTSLKCRGRGNQFLNTPLGRVLCNV